MSRVKPVALKPGECAHAAKSISLPHIAGIGARSEIGYREQNVIKKKFVAQGINNNMTMNGMKHFNRTALETSMDGDFDTGNVRYKARERYSFGVSDPLGIYGSPGTS